MWAYGTKNSPLNTMLVGSKTIWYVILIVFDKWAIYILISKLPNLYVWNF